MNFKIFYSHRYFQPALHILFWGVLFFSSYLFKNDETWKGFNEWQYKMLVYKIVLALLFYFNTYVLYPAFYKKKGMMIYLAGVLITIIAAYFLTDLVQQYIDKLDLNHEGKDMFRGRGPRSMRPHGDDWAHRTIFEQIWDEAGRLWWRLLPYFFVAGTSIIYRLQTDSSSEQKIRKEKENENLKTELSFLRSQVSPHFIFNTLNNMVSLARKKSDQLEPSLIQLSNLIRYMLYENDDEKVTLDKEIGYLKSYITLQLLRFGDDVTITFNPPENTGGYKIESMLLAPFVENAFKHGVGMVEDPQINIMLEINDETGWLDFKVMNTIAPQQDSKDKSSGIGLANVRRRLELLYPGKFNLDIMKTESVFIADLKIKLS